MRRCVWGLCLCLLAPTSAFAKGPYELSYKVVKSFSTLVDKSAASPLSWDVNSPDGLAWDGSGLWVSGCDGMSFVKLDLDGKLVDRFMLPNMEMADHLAFDGTHLWAVVHSMAGDPGPPDGRLIRIDLQTRRIVKTIEVPFRDAASMTPMGMGYDGKYLWTNDPLNKRIYRIDAETGEGKDTPYFDKLQVNGNTVSPCGVSWDGHGCLWVSDLSLGAYLQVDPKSREVVSFLVPPDNPDPTKYGTFRPSRVKKLFTGMTTDGERVWIVDELEGNPLVYQIDVAFPKTGPCAHPVKVGEACTVEGQPFCAKDAICYGEGGASPTCHQRCDRASKTPCANGSACWQKAGVGDVCVPGPAASGAFAAACSANSECQSALCVTDLGSAGFCSERCTAGAADACPSGYQCASGGRCEPRADGTAGGGGGGGCTAASAPPSTPSLVLLLFVAVFSIRRRAARRRD
ncbi:MAG: hypothetical protein KC503_15760 [Myxococcales bacterium]|nr:hypothetical protein [Myxococcales bacterium]